MEEGRLGKGVLDSVRRAALLPRRYGLRPERIRSRLREMSAALRRFDITPTVPVTAITLDRHPSIAADLAGLDVAIHGYRHIAYSGRPAASQARDLDAARASFSRHGIESRGFRAPYLLADATTSRLLRERGFAFDSSTPHFVLPLDHPMASDALRLATSRYGEIPKGPANPELQDGLVELPVALPDDEILVDGLGITNPATLGRVLDSMLGAACSTGSLLVLQAHPERFHLLREAIESLLGQATDRGAWKASLSEVAAWLSREGVRPLRWPEGHSWALSVSGDLDAVAIDDFLQRAWRA